MSVLAEKPFPSYLETESRLPLWIWWVLRVATFGVMLLTVWAIATRPEIGFAIFWSILIPILPIVFVTAPGLWRQICPMAFVNQLPRTFGLSAEKRLPIRFKNIAYFISVLAFFFLVSLRHIYFNSDPVALLTLIFTALALALIGGFVFAGRSGWCGTFCPLGPIQKAYGHAPVVVVRNGYCPTCIGCQKNCYDFNPKASFHADLSDSDPWYAGHKRFFAAGLPGFALAYFTAPDPTIVGLGTYYLYIVGWIVTALGIYMAATVFFRITDYQAAAFAVMIAILVFYWFMAEKILATIFELTGGGSEPAWADEVFLGVVIVLAGRAYFNGLRLEKEYRALDLSKSPTKAGVRLENVPLEDAGDNVVVDRASGRSFAANPGRTLLEGIESAGLAQDFGCRMGMCGADPIVVVDGGGNLSKPSDEELSTLRRIGLEGKARMACVCRPTGGPVTIDLAADPKDEFVPDNAGDEIDWGEVAGTRRVVIVGNGTSGTTAADSIRRLSASCEIDLIARESHHFYNRMAIGRLLYTRSGLEELYLMPPDWPKARRINLHLNTQVTAIDRSACEVLLGTGEKLEYDRLILATGASAFVPPAKGADLPGCFVLREAADAQSTRSWRQEMQCTRAVVLGGGVLGVEAADSLRRLNLHTTIVQRSERLMDRELDEKGSAILRRFLDGLGMDVVTGASAAAILGEDRVREVELDNGSILPAEIFVACAGIRANTAIAVDAGLEVNRGVVVDDHMRTSDPKIFAVGDVAELPGTLGGLWTIGTAQAEVAASAVFGKDAAYEAPSALVSLKVEGIDVKAFGSREVGDDVEEIHDSAEPDNLHRKMFVKDGRAVGAVFVGPPGTGKEIARIIQQRLEVSNVLDRLRRFEWSALEDV